ALPVAALPVATAAPLAATARGGPPQPDGPRPAPAPPLIARPAIGALAIQRANAAPALPAVPAAAPEVHITIGRVDIRAEAPAAARPAPRHSPPPPSLADYLARRDRAGR
ncbi:MAG: hypothetical protein ACJ8EB_10455, partial [Allosphingosinicella sp.]